MNELLILRDVTKTYRRGGAFSKDAALTVLRGINMSISAGECVGLVGESGSGKSTLGRLVLGVEAPTAGTIVFKGRALTKSGYSRKERREVQAVLQNAADSCNPRMTAAQIIAEPLRNFDGLRGTELRAKVAELMRVVGLEEDEAVKLPHRFSGGQLQRICIARALASRPQLVLLDEALSSLDMLVQSQILDLLAKLRSTGTAYLFVTHDLRLVRAFCDRAYIMEDGRAEEFDARSLTADRELPELQKLVAAMPPALPVKGNEGDTING